MECEEPCTFKWAAAEQESVQNHSLNTGPAPGQVCVTPGGGEWRLESEDGAEWRRREDGEEWWRIDEGDGRKPSLDGGEWKRPEDGAEKGRNTDPSGTRRDPDGPRARTGGDHLDCSDTPGGHREGASPSHASREVWLGQHADAWKTADVVSCLPVMECEEPCTFKWAAAEQESVQNHSLNTGPAPGQVCVTPGGGEWRLESEDGAEWRRREDGEEWWRIDEGDGRKPSLDGGEWKRPEDGAEKGRNTDPSGTRRDPDGPRARTGGDHLDCSDTPGGHREGASPSHASREVWLGQVRSRFLGWAGRTLGKPP
ncbi:uncharacterized protein LOC144767071 [Lissotriton helveticus]